MNIPTNINDLIIDSIAEGIIVVDKDFNIVKANERAHEMFGYSGNSLINNNINILIPQTYHAAHVDHQSKFIKNPSKRSMGLGLDLKGVKKDGVEFPVEISLNHFSDGNQMFVLALVSDVTQKVKIQEEIKSLNTELEQKVISRTSELKASEALYKSIAENFPNGSIILLDEHFIPLFRKGKGVVAHEDLKLETIFPDAYKIVLHALNNHQGSEITALEFEDQSKYKEVKILKLNAEPEQTRYLLIEEDVTQRKEAEIHLKETIQKEKDVNEIKSRFLTMASHEFRTPLATVLSSTHLIDKYIEKGNVDKIVKHTTRIGSAVNHLTDILNDFLSLDKIEAGKVTVEIKPVNIMELCTDVIEDIQVLAKEGQFIEYAFSGKDQIIDSDPKIITHIMINLLSNAIKYSGENGVIMLKTNIKDTEAGQILNITVKDDGIGIPKGDLKNLFTRFYRAKNVENISGTGLGLNIVKNYVHLLDGTIEVDSTLGKGTTFNITLPLK